MQPTQSIHNVVLKTPNHDTVTESQRTRWPLLWPFRPFKYILQLSFLILAYSSLEALVSFITINHQNPNQSWFALLSVTKTALSPIQWFYLLPVTHLVENVLNIKARLGFCGIPITGLYSTILFTNHRMS
jgi:hypothetical protein